MSAFRRKARIIQTLDDDPVGIEEPKKEGKQFLYTLSIPAHPLPSPLPFADLNKPANALPAEPNQTPTAIKFGRKPNKSSSLRKSINFAADDHADGDAPVAAEDEGDEGAPVVIRPSISRSGSTKQKKKPTSSRLSFGPGGGEGDDGATSTPRKSLGQKAAENNALKIKLPSRILGGEEDRPRYSKEYLSELQSSTPNTPHDMSTLTIEDEDVQMAMDIDPSELEGATVVPAPEQATSTTLTSRTPAATILTQAQIREKKERRARLALQGDADDYIGLSDDEDEEDRLGSKKKKDSRLIAEDEDLGEGYDEYVEDGGLSLGRTAEKKARLQAKKEMAELIASAESPDEDGENSDDSVERRADYEAAQRKKGLGVEALGGDGDEIGANVIPKMRPLPDLQESLQRMKDLVQGLDDEVARKRARIAELKREKEEVVKREAEVQEILNQAGAKYQAVLGTNSGLGADAAKMVEQSPLRVPLPPGLVPDQPAERGLESFGTTPVAGAEYDDDEDMT
jgi:hypothetical protein